MNRDPVWVEVFKRRRETASIASLELASVDGSPLEQFSAGSHIDVHVTDTLVRQYSLLKSADNPACYEIGVLLSDTSRGGSRHIHEMFQTGHRFRIGTPRNHFAIVEHATHALLFAGGIGITPILSMAESLESAGRDFELHYSVRSRDAAAYRDRIMNSGFAGRSHFHYDDDGASAMDLKSILAAVHDDPGRHLYVCGPEGYMNAVFGAAATLGWTRERLHRESFTAQVQETADDAEFEVEIAGTGASFRVPVGRSLASVLVEHGIRIPLSCEQGLCGTCLTTVVAGIPDHRDFFMNDDEHALNNRITPCCSRSRSLRLVIDV